MCERQTGPSLSLPRPGNGCGTKSGPGPWTWGGGRGRGGRGAGVFIKARNAHPVPDLVSRGAARAGSAIYRPFPARRVPSPTLRGGRGQSCCVPTARVITPCARVESQRGELRTGTGMRPRVSGSAIHRLFPPKACPCPPQRGRRGRAAVSRQRGL